MTQDEATNIDGVRSCRALGFIVKSLDFFFFFLVKSEATEEFKLEIDVTGFVF